MSLNLRQLQARVERAEAILDHEKQHRDAVVDPIMKAYGVISGFTVDTVEFSNDVVEVSYSWEDGWHERMEGMVTIPQSVFDAEDPIQTAKDVHAAEVLIKARAAVEAKAGAELREYERLRQKFENI
jgi:hypothetical protein